MGTLGLAWTGDLKNAGGVCEKNGVSYKCSSANLKLLSFNVEMKAHLDGNLSPSMNWM